MNYLFVILLLMLPMISNGQGIGLKYEIENPEAEFTSNWKNFCKELGEDLTFDPKKLALGTLSEKIFPRYSCDNSYSSNPWQFLLFFRGNLVKISLIYRDGDRIVRIFDHAFAVKGTPSTFLKESSRSILGKIIRESFPVKGVVKLNHLTKQIAATSEVSEHLNHKTYVLCLYNLNPDHDRFDYQLLGVLKKGRKRSRGSGKYHRYYKLGQSFRSKEGIYYVQDTDWPEKKTKRIADLMKSFLKTGNLLSSIDRLIFDSFSSSFTGIRYGQSIISGESLASNSSIISSFLEIRGGPIKGFRLYYDLSPEISRQSPAGNEVFSWNRLTGGWAFSLDLPFNLGSAIPRIDIAPKIGVFSLKSINFTEYQNSLYLLTFEAKNQLNLGVEAGLEIESAPFYYRAWLATDISGRFSIDGDETKLESIRTGLDITYDLLMFESGINIELLFFTYGEKLKISKQTEADQSTLNIDALSFNLGFSGLGVNISW